MMVYTKGFVFDNKTSDEFGLKICNIDGENETDTSVGSIEFSKTNVPIQNKWYKSGNATYSEALKFGFQIMKVDFSPIDAYEYSAIARWLERKDSFKDFMIVRQDYDNIHFYVQMTAEPIEVAGNIIGISVTGNTNAPFGFAQEVKYVFDTENGNTFNLVDFSDEIGYIYPDVEIDVRTAGDIKITNLIDNTTFKLNNCVANEVINISGKVLQINTNSISHNLYEDTNFQFPKIINDYGKIKNQFKIDGDCVVTMKYRPIRKVVV